jgi:hypothetical protein
MKYISESDTLLLSPAEMDALRARLKVIPNLLSPILDLHPDGGKKADLDEFGRLTDAQQQEILNAVKTLYLPECSILWHETIVDQSITRSAAVWDSASPKTWAVISWNGDGIWLRRRSASELALGLEHFLAIYPGLRSNGLHLLLSTAAALTTMAALDHSILVEMLAKLQHASPTAVFGVNEIQSRFEQASVEDFRWPLLFLQKLTPVDILELVERERLLACLNELVEAGLLVRVENKEYQAEDVLFAFSEAGGLLRQGFLHETSKVAWRVSALSSDGNVSHEVFFFLRDPLGLWMFDLTGGEAAITDLDQIEFRQIAEKILKYEPPNAPERLAL